MRLTALFVVAACCRLSFIAASENTPVPSVEVARLTVPEARQAVAVDKNCFYAIANRAIGKYDKESGTLIKRWEASTALPLEHLNSGIVIGNELYCAHSNFPRYPETNSVEVWDTNGLEHLRSYSLGICEGSLTWVDWYEDAWWAVFAHYSEKVNSDPHAKQTAWTSLVKFDRQWRRLAGWVFPAEVIKQFHPHSCSGGSWGSDGLLYCTGHDRGELYALALPQAGSTLKLLKTYAVPFTGQGFAWDPGSARIAYGINRANGEVVVAEIPIDMATNSKLVETKKSNSTPLKR